MMSASLRPMLTFPNASTAIDTAQSITLAEPVAGSSEPPGVHNVINHHAYVQVAVE